MLRTLKRRLKRLEAKRARITERANASEDANEVRSLTEELEDLNEEIAEVREEIEDLEAAEDQGEGEGEGEDNVTRSTVPAGATLVNGQVRGSFVANSEDEVEPTATMEYRTAFMAYVQKGTPITRNGEVITTADTGAAIPMTVMNEVINTVRKRYGNLYGKVRKMSVQGGVEFPIGALQATFKWINESTVSPRQKAGNLGKVSFGYHTAELRIAQSFLSSILTVSDFEAKLTEVIAIAYLQAMDYAIVNGSGDGAPTGILNDERVTNTITMTAAQFADWTEWRKKFFAKLPLGYRAGEFIFPMSTVETYLETMADANNNPIFRQATGLEVNDGDAVNPNGRFFGRNIALVEEDIIQDFDTAEKGDVVGIYWQPEEYAVNENFGFTMRRYFDEETNEWVDKALVVVDGKVLNPTGYYKIIKG